MRNGIRMRGMEFRGWEFAEKAFRFIEIRSLSRATQDSMSENSGSSVYSQDFDAYLCVSLLIKTRNWGCITLGYDLISSYMLNKNSGFLFPFINCDTHSTTFDFKLPLEGLSSFPGCGSVVPSLNLHFHMNLQKRKWIYVE